MFATATETPVTRSGFSGSHCDKSPDGRKRGWWGWWDILDKTPHDICLEANEFVLEGPHGARLIGIPTGRTRWFGSTLTATFNVFEIDTVVEMVGDLPVIVGRRGKKLPGTWKTHISAFKSFN